MAPRPPAQGNRHRQALMPIPVKTLLCFSLAANLGLGWAVFRNEPAGTPPAQATPSAPGLTSLATEWAALREATANDDTALVARLRAEGFPPHVLRAFVKAELAERSAEQRRTHKATTGMDAFWRSYSARYRGNSEAKAALRALDRQQVDLMRQLLGPDAASPWETERRQRRYGDLLAGKAQQIELTNRDYDDLIQQFNREANDVFLKEDAEKNAYLNKERQADIAALLTPEELAAYELRESPTAKNLQWKLRFFDSTESEYAALYKLRKVYDDQFANESSEINASAKSRAQDQLRKDIEALLGDTRYAHYKVATDASYGSVNSLVSSLDLPVGTAKEIVAYKLDTVQRWIAVKQNTSLNQADRDARIASLVAETKTVLSEKLGANGYAAYRKNENISSWISNISKSTGPTKP